MIYDCGKLVCGEVVRKPDEEFVGELCAIVCQDISLCCVDDNLIVQELASHISARDLSVRNCSVNFGVFVVDENNA